MIAKLRLCGQQPARFSATFCGWNIFFLVLLGTNATQAFTSSSFCTETTQPPVIILDRTVSIPQDSQSQIQLSATDFGNFETTTYVLTLPSDTSNNLLGQMFFGLVDKSITSSTFGVVSKGKRFPSSTPVAVVGQNDYWVVYAPPRYQRSKLSTNGLSYDPYVVFTWNSQNSCNKTSRIQRLSIVVTPVETRPELGGTGASIAFDGFDDVYSRTVLDWPQEKFTLTFWVRAESHRTNQIILSYEPLDKTTGDPCQYALIVYDVSSLKIALPLRSFVYDTKLSVVGGEWYYITIMLSRLGELFAYQFSKKANSIIPIANGVSTTGRGFAAMPAKGLLHLGQDMYVFISMSNVIKCVFVVYT